jgi:NADPH:quinone reductase-like Zn-dependent oxidoreductase
VQSVQELLGQFARTNSPYVAEKLEVRSLTSLSRPCILYAFLLDNHKFGEREGSRMADDGSILVTGAAGQLGAVGRTVTGLLLERGLPVRAMVRREDDRAAALRAAGAEVVVGDLLEPADV